MRDDQFTKLYMYMQQRFGNIDDQFTEIRSDITGLRGDLGELSARVEGYHNEMEIGFRQAYKLRQAVKQLSQGTGIKLKVKI
jgi:putative heme iron utilization protein